MNETNETTVVDTETPAASETGGAGSSEGAETPAASETSVINQVVEAVIGLMNAVNPFATVTRGALPTGVGLTCEVGPSTPLEVYLDKYSYIPLDVTMNGKHGNLKTLSDAMNDIHAALTRAVSYPSGDSWEIVDIVNYTLPQVIGRENNNEWLMASSLSVKFYWKGD